jgi:TolB-like protein/cytochrome c-type biogenesis protein CcmH/NrfG
MGLVSELRRRNVLRMVVLYVVAAWLIMQVADVLVGLEILPTWIGPAIFGLLAVGFPIALIFSWFYELTPEGLSLEKDVEPGESITHVTGRRLDFLVISLLCAAVILFAYDKWWIDPPPEKSIAVLPFSNRSALAEDVYFVDGIHDDILAQLTKLSSFEKVISRTSMEQYRETNKTMPQIARELSVATILEGGVQRVGDQVHVNVQLIEAATDEHLWAETYDRRLTVENIFLVQEEIARDVARALRLTLTPQEDSSLSKIPTTSLEAYRLYQLGRQENYNKTAESSERATEYFEEAIRSDPDYAQAYAGLASAYMFQHFDGGLSRKDALRQARPMAERAIQLDPMLAEGYAALGNVNTWDYQFAAAESNFDTAIALNPGLARARIDYGVLLTQLLRRFDEAIIQLEAATRLSPFDTGAHRILSEAYANAHRSQDALDILHHALDLAPDNPATYEFLGHVYGSFLGRLDEAVKWFAKGLEQDPSSVRLRPNLAAFYLDLGDIPTARLLIEQQIILAKQGQLSVELLQMALLMHLGRYEEALEFAEEEWRQRQWRVTASALATLYSLNGQYQRALEVNDQRIKLYEEIDPHPETKVTARNLRRAIDRAAILAGMGENARAQQLLNNCLEVAKTVSSRTLPLVGNFQLVQIYTLLGDVPNALLALRESIDEGKRSGWWINLLHSPITAPLRNEPQFQEMVEEIRADMAAQLENVREMQRTGEMPPLLAIDH